MTRPNYVYVASSWRNALYPGVIAALRAAGIDHYDFRNPAGGTGFSWDQVGGTPFSRAESIDTYREMIDHPRAVAGFASDFEAMQRADAVVLILPCGKSAHLELGWAVGAGKRTAVLLDDPVEPELMYRMVDYLAPSLLDLLAWLGVADNDNTVCPRVGARPDASPNARAGDLVAGDVVEAIRAHRRAYLEQLADAGILTSVPEVDTLDRARPMCEDSACAQCEGNA